MNGVRLLLAELDSVKEEGRCNWVARCPVHDDRTPSLAITVREETGGGRMAVYIHCKGCDANGEDVCRAVEVKLGYVLYGTDNEEFRKRRSGWVEPISDEQVARWVADLWDSKPKVHRYLTAKRGLTEETLRRFNVGLDVTAPCYVIPVYDEAGRLVNLRRYRPNGTPKIKNSAGHGSPPRLFPHPSDDRPGVVVCEGEWDCMLLHQNGFMATTGTHGVGTWLPEWSAALVGRHVAVLYDVGAEEQQLAQAHGDRILRAGAASVRVVDLPLPFVGDDVTDWFTTYGRSAAELRELITEATPLGRRASRKRKRPARKQTSDSRNATTVQTTRT